MPDWEPSTPHTLRSPGPETDRYPDWRRTGLQTIALRDISRPWVVFNSGKISKIERKGGVSRVALRPDFWQEYVKMYVKTSFF